MRDVGAGFRKKYVASPAAARPTTSERSATMNSVLTRPSSSRGHAGAHLERASDRELMPAAAKYANESKPAAPTPAKTHDHADAREDARARDVVGASDVAGALDDEGPRELEPMSGKVTRTERFRSPS